MSSRLKFLEVAGSILIVQFGLIFVGGTLFLVRELPLSMARDVPSLLGRVGIALGASLVCIIIFEVAAFQMRQSLAMNARNVEMPDGNVYERVATVTQYTDLLKTAVGFIVLLVVDLGVGYLLSRSRFTLTTELVAYLAFFLVWIVVRRPVLSTLGRGLDSGQPHYEIAPAGDALLITRIAGMRKGRGPIRIGFDEIEDVRVFTGVEGEAFRNYELGPNVELGIRQTKDLIDFGRGAISRPSVYTIGSESSIGKSVLLRGPNLFFWTHFGGQDGADVLAAFAEYRGRSKYGPAGAPSP